MNLKNDKKLKFVLKIAAIVLVCAIALLATVLLTPYIMSLKDEANRAAFEEKIRSLGVGGFAVMLLLQIAQVIFAVIPGEPVELVMGVLYGPWGGLAVCLLGSVIGTAVIFCCVNRFGHGFVDRFVSSDSFARFKFLHNAEKRDLLIFFLFLIPGTPKDVLAYFSPFTKIPLGRFLILTSVARIPAIISSTYVGHTLIKGDIFKSIIVYLIVGAVSGVCLLLYNRIMAKRDKDANDDN